MDTLPVPRSRRLSGPWVIGCFLIALAALRFGPSMDLPFLGDDYAFLDLTRTNDLPTLLANRDTRFGWYRPWSREVHFWTLEHVVGLRSWAFRGASVLLWLGGLLAYHAVVRRFAGERTALIATVGVASLALWGTPVLWISGSQDLWMIALAMGTLLAFQARRLVLALPMFALALLSKETAAVMPLVLAAQARFVEHGAWRDVVRRTGWFFAVLAGWVLMHPILLQRLVGPREHVLEVENRPPLPVMLARNLLALVNLDLFPRPTEFTVGTMVRASLAAVLVIVAVLWLARARAATSVTPTSRRDVLLFASIWTLAGWAPMCLPLVGWHAYYGCLGAMGAWVLVGAIMPRRAGVVAAICATAVLLAFAQAYTPSTDWGNEWYQRRAGTMLEGMRSEMLRVRPSFPKYSRIYLGHIPNNIGLIAGSTPAVRVWYDDLTMKAGFFSYYRPRRPGEHPGEDFFFWLDTLRGLSEIHHGPEDVARAVSESPTWTHDHEQLAVVLLRAGAPLEAAVEFEKIGQLWGRPDALVMAAVCRRLARDTARADSLIDVVATRTGSPRADVASHAARLQANLPPPILPLPGGSGFD